MLTGIVNTQEIRIEAIKLVWEIEGVKEVINEIVKELKLPDFKIIIKNSF